MVLPQVGQQATRENLIQMSSLAEKEGFDSLQVFERFLWPLNPQAPYPGSPDVARGDEESMMELKTVLEELVSYEQVSSFKSKYNEMKKNQMTIKK